MKKNEKDLEDVEELNLKVRNWEVVENKTSQWRQLMEGRAANGSPERFSIIETVRNNAENDLEKSSSSPNGWEETSRLNC